MSQENVNVIKSMYAAFATGNIPVVIGALDSQVEWWEAENFVYADQNPYVGPNAVLEGVFMRIGTDWDGFAVTPENVLDASEIAIGYGYYSGTYKKNGKHVRAQFAHFFTFREGKVVKFQQYTDTAQFQKAVGNRRMLQDAGAKEYFVSFEGFQLTLAVATTGSTSLRNAIRSSSGAPESRALDEGKNPNH